MKQTCPITMPKKSRVFLKTGIKLGLIVYLLILLSNLVVFPLSVHAETENLLPDNKIISKEQPEKSTNNPELTKRMILAAKKLGVPEVTGLRISNPWQIEGKNIIAYQKLLLIEETDGAIKPLYISTQIKKEDREVLILPNNSTESTKTNNPMKEATTSPVLKQHLLIFDNIVFKNNFNDQQLKDGNIIFNLLRFRTQNFNQLNGSKSLLIGEKAVELGLIPADKILAKPELDEAVKEDPPVIPPLVSAPQSLITIQSTKNPTPVPQPPIPQSQNVIGIWQGVASYYSRNGCIGCSPNRIMANGEPLNDNALTIAFMRAPLNSIVRITNTNNGASVVARVTDTGGFERLGKIADLSVGVRDAIGGSSITPVKIELLN